jgi:hypothetical protein
VRGLFSGSTGISYNSTTGAISCTITQYTDALARAAHSFTAGSGAYNSTTGVITIPTNNNQLTNGAGYITSITSGNVTTALGFTPLSNSGNVTIGGYLTVTGAGTSSSIYMSDSDNGQREMHCNSDRIGFLTQAGAWGAWCDDSGNWNAANFSGSSSGTNTGDQTNISGNAATASSVSGLTLTSSANGINPDSVTQNQIGYNTSVSLFGQTDGGLHSSAYSSAWIHQIYGDFRTGQMAIRGKNSGTWQGWRTVVDSSNVSGYTSGNTNSISSAVGGAYIWTGVNQFQSNRDTSSNSAMLQAFSSSGGATMAFHRGAVYATNMGLDSDNVFRIGGWSAGANRLQMDMSGNLTMAGDVTAYSDARVKENIVTVDNALNKVLALRGVYYNRIDSDDKKTKIGVIAQETLQVVPEVVNQDAAGMYNVSYGNLAGLFIEAFKEQQKEIEELKTLIYGITR